MTPQCPLVELYTGLCDWLQSFRPHDVQSSHMSSFGWPIAHNLSALQSSAPALLAMAPDLLLLYPYFAPTLLLLCMFNSGFLNSHLLPNLRKYLSFSRSVTFIVSGNTTVSFLQTSQSSIKKMYFQTQCVIQLKSAHNHLTLLFHPLFYKPDQVSKPDEVL